MSDEKIVLIQAGFKNPRFIEVREDGYSYFEVVTNEGNEQVVKMKRINKSGRYEIIVLEKEEIDKLEKSHTASFMTQLICVLVFIALVGFLLFKATAGP